MDEPLVFTSKGNLPEKDLRYETKWDNRQSIELKKGKLQIIGDIVFIETYYLGDEVVKQSAHVFKNDTEEIGALLTKMG